MISGKGMQPAGLRAIVSLFWAGVTGKGAFMAMRMIREKGRWLLWLLLAAATLVLAASLETGKVHALNSAFTFLGALTNVITPNGDGRNDVALLCFDNPRSSDVSGVVYDLRGNHVSGLSPGTGANCPGENIYTEKMTWDGRSEGLQVPGGIYIYQLQSEGKTITGTVMVVR